MDYARHEGLMRQPTTATDRTPMRKTLEFGARAGVAKAIAQLAGPELPEALSYLWDWFQELDMARPLTMEGPAAFTYGMIADWARLTDRHPSPEEVRGLFLLDLTLRHPEPVDA